VGALWIFRWDKEKKLFAHVLNEHNDRYIPVPLSGAVTVEKNGDLSFSTEDSHQPVKYRWLHSHYHQLP
jgi:hypothetical protein